MKANDELNSILELLMNLQLDKMIPNNVRTKIKNAYYTLSEENKNLSLRIDKSIQELDDVAEDQNLPMGTKAMIWELFSKLECIKQ
jgi:uncharacterized protein (UPF0147 family)